MQRISILAEGREMRPRNVLAVCHHRTREPYVEVSQADAEVIRKDLQHAAAMKAKLAAIPVAELIRLSQEAARHFMSDTLPAGSTGQTPQQYIRDVSATTGWPEAIVQVTMRKMESVLSGMEQTLSGLSRGLDLAVLDEGVGSVNGRGVSLFPTTDALGVVLPESSPRVHALWAPSTALKTPVILKPGSAEPWTPLRTIYAFLRAGAPREAFSYYPSDLAGGQEILRRCGRGMVFGDASVTRLWVGDVKMQVHGPGYSKVLIADDCAGNWESYMDVLAESVMDNAGRSPVNASGIWVTCHGHEIAEALAARLSGILPRRAEDPQAELAPFLDDTTAQRISSIIDNDLRLPGAVDLTRKLRRHDRFAHFENCAYLLPTVVECGPTHSLANREFPFPFVSVVEVHESQIPEVLGKSLVVTAITDNPRLRHRLLTSPLMGRLNFGPIATVQVRSDQPSEGNLFEHLYQPRAFQAA